LVGWPGPRGGRVLRAPAYAMGITFIKRGPFCGLPLLFFLVSLSVVDTLGALLCLRFASFKTSFRSSTSKRGMRDVFGTWIWILVGSKISVASFANPSIQSRTLLPSLSRELYAMRAENSLNQDVETDSHLAAVT
jgi:hypothetical protein